MTWSTMFAVKEKEKDENKRNEGTLEAAGQIWAAEARILSISRQSRWRGEKRGKAATKRPFGGDARIYK